MEIGGRADPVHRQPSKVRRGARKAREGGTAADGYDAVETDSGAPTSEVIIGVAAVLSPYDGRRFQGRQYAAAGTKSKGAR